MSLRRLALCYGCASLAVLLASSPSQADEPVDRSGSLDAPETEETLERWERFKKNGGKVADFLIGRGVKYIFGPAGKVVYDLGKGTETAPPGADEIPGVDPRLSKQAQEKQRAAYMAERERVRREREEQIKKEQEARDRQRQSDREARDFDRTANARERAQERDRQSQGASAGEGRSVERSEHPKQNQKEGTRSEKFSPSRLP